MRHCYVYQCIHAVAYVRCCNLCARSTVDASRPIASVIADARRHFDPDVCFVLGGPGCGKGTQCEHLVANYQFTHLSAGDLLRAELARGSPQGASIKALMERGLLVPVEFTLVLLKAAMKASGGDRFLVDGFPRAIDQAAVFEEAVCHPNKVLFFDVPDDVLIKRLLHRGLTSGRADDNAETIKHRLHTFHNQSEPVIDRYSAEGKVALIDGTGTIGQVSEATDSEFRSEFFVISGSGSNGAAVTSYGQRLGDRFGYVFLSVPALVDAEIRLGSPQGKRLEQLQKVRRSGDKGRVVCFHGFGRLVCLVCDSTCSSVFLPCCLVVCLYQEDAVSTEEVIKLLLATMDRTRKQKFIVAGFPNTAAEVAAFEGAIGVISQWLFIEDAAARFGAPVELASTFELLQSQGKLTAVTYNGKQDVFPQLQAAFQPRVALLVGASGSGRGEFARKYVHEVVVWRCTWPVPRCYLASGALQGRQGVCVCSSACHTPAACGGRYRLRAGRSHRRCFGSEAHRAHRRHAASAAQRHRAVVGQALPR